MTFARSRLETVVASAWLAMLASSAAAAEDLPNPFAAPPALRTSSGTAAVAVDAPPSLELRATLVRARDSSANIGGTIVRVGQKVGDYRLLSVREGAAVLADASGATYVLEIEPRRRAEP